MSLENQASALHQRSAGTAAGFEMSAETRGWLIDAVNATVRASQVPPPALSKKTQLIASTTLNYWMRWYELRFGAVFEIPLDLLQTKQALLAYIVDHIDLSLFQKATTDYPGLMREVRDSQLSLLRQLAREGLRRSERLPRHNTLVTDLSSLRLAGSPLLDEQAFASKAVRDLLIWNKRQSSYADSPVKAASFTDEDIAAMFRVCDFDLLGLRAMAAISFCRAVGPISADSFQLVRREHLARRDDGTYLLDLEQSQLRARSRRTPLTGVLIGAAALALDAWLTAKGPQAQ